MAGVVLRNKCLLHPCQMQAPHSVGNIGQVTGGNIGRYIGAAGRYGCGFRSIVSPGQDPPDHNLILEVPENGIIAVIELVVGIEERLHQVYLIEVVPLIGQIFLVAVMAIDDYISGRNALRRSRTLIQIHSTSAVFGIGIYLLFCAGPGHPAAIHKRASLERIGIWHTAVKNGSCRKAGRIQEIILQILKSQILIIAHKSCLGAVRSNGSPGREINHSKTLGGKIRFRRSEQHDLGPVADEGNLLKQGRQGWIRNKTGKARLPILNSVDIYVIIIAVTLGANAVGEIDHLPVCLLTYAAFGELGHLQRHNGSVVAERKGCGTIPQKMDSAGAVRNGELNRICVKRNGVGHLNDFCLVRPCFHNFLYSIGFRPHFAHLRCLHILFQITGTAKNSHVKILNVSTVVQSFGISRTGGAFHSERNGQLLPLGQCGRYRTFHIILPDAGQQQGKQTQQPYPLLLFHRFLSPHVNVSISTLSSPQYQESYTQRISAVVTFDSVTTPESLFTFTAPLTDQ